MCMHCANTHLKINRSSKETGYVRSMRYTVKLLSPIYTHSHTHTPTYASSWGDLRNISRWMSQRFALLSSP